MFEVSAVRSSSVGNDESLVTDSHAFTSKKTFSGKSFKDVDHFVNEDDQGIFCKYWIPHEEPIGLVLVVHGGAEHCGRYTRIASLFSSLKLLVFSHDHVGHGESEGERFNITDYRIYLRDLLQHIALMKSRYPELPLYLYGHSMGAALALLLAHENPSLFKFVILSSAFINRINPVLAFFAKHLSQVFPQLPYRQLNANFMTRSEEQIQKYVSDPLVFHEAFTVRMGYQLIRLCSDASNAFQDVSFIYLLLHGTNDELCPIDGAKELDAKSKSCDKTFKVYEDCKHELINESEGIPERYLADIKEWMMSRLT